MQFRSILKKQLTVKNAMYVVGGGTVGFGLFRYGERQEMTKALHSVYNQFDGISVPDPIDVTKLYEIHPGKMRAGQWQELEDDRSYSVGFAVKPGFEAQLGKKTLSHASISIESDEEYLVIGRQSPAFRSMPKEEKSNDPFHKTILDNEKDYTMPSVLSNFKIAETRVSLTGAEIKAAFDITQKKICEQELCDMTKSNCCTAATEAFCNMFKEVYKREDSPEKAETLKKLYDLICQASQLNYSQGISNNATVKKSLSEVRQLFTEYLLAVKPGNTPSKS